MNRNKRASLRCCLWVLFFLVGWATASQAQNPYFNQLSNSRNFQLAEAIIRVAEPSQLADTVLIWGDVTMPGTYLVPRGTRLMEMISYAKGPARYNSTETMLDWSRLRVSVVLSPANGGPAQRINLHYSDPMDMQLRNLHVQNFDVVSLEVKRKPVFVDYLRVVAPVISAVATSVLVVRNIQGK